jgi:hypothetical protein
MHEREKRVDEGAEIGDNSVHCVEGAETLKLDSTHEFEALVRRATVSFVNKFIFTPYDSP